MPWIDENECTGCGLCVEECLVNAISMENEKAEIDMDKCIRCGKCHDVCPQKAVKHDSEKIPEEVEANVEKTKNFMAHFKTEEEKQTCLSKMIKFFNKEKVVMEKTLMQLTALTKKDE